MKLDQIFKVLKIYSDELVKNEPVPEGRWERFDKALEKEEQPFRDFRRSRPVSLSLGLGFSLLLFLIFFTALRQRDNYLHVQDLRGCALVRVKDVSIPVFKDIKIREGSRVMTRADSPLTISRRHRDDSVLVRINPGSGVLIEKIRLYSFIRVRLLNGGLTIDMKSRKDHLVQLNVDRYDLYLKGSRMEVIYNNTNDIKIILREGHLDIESAGRSLLSTDKKGTVSIRSNRITPEVLEENGSQKLEKIGLDQDEYLYSFDTRYFIIHNFKKDLYLFDNRTGDLFLHLLLPVRSKSIPVIINNDIYISGYDKNLYVYSLENGKWDMIRNTGTLLYSAPIPFRDEIILMNTEGVLYRIDKSRNILKRTDLSIPVWAPLLCADNKLFISSIDRHFYVYDLDKNKITGKIPIRDKVTGSKPILFRTAIVIKTAGGLLMAFDRDKGTLLWIETGSPAHFVFNDEDDLYRANRDGRITRIDHRTGKVLKEYDTGKEIKDVFAHEGRLFLIGYDGNVCTMDLQTRKLNETVQKALKLFHDGTRGSYFIYTCDKTIKKCY
ncbi:MAG: PQQ-binding-like beta-propeller repeat protein [bacterium]|nr:PQQ-binding-like beta-propeller repeat protein [bacterium]